MAIKINNTTVIDNSRNLCNAGTITASCIFGDGTSLTGVTPDRILKPANQEPTNAATDVDLEPTLTGTEFVSTVGSSHCCTCFQVSECSDFSTCNSFTCEIAGACTSITVPDGCLSPGTQHFFRLRYEDEDSCCSDFSDATCFTTFPLPETLGESICGGFYMGTIGISDGSCYYLIMAPNATGCAKCGWKSTNTDSADTKEDFDGYGETYDHLTAASPGTHRAGNWTATRSIDGFSDWYLPAICELGQLYQNCACAPVGEGFDSTAAGGYWSSTEANSTTATCLRFDTGGTQGNFKITFRNVRAIRRVPF